jgi:hypothetical protein
VPDNYVAGKVGFVAVNAVVYPFAKWRLSLKVGKPKVTNFTSEGFQALVSAINAATMSLEGAYNIGNMPLTNGFRYTFHFGFTTAIYLVGDFIVDLDLNNDVEDVPRVTVSGESTGPFTLSIA